MQLDRDMFKKKEIDRIAFYIGQLAFAISIK